MIIRIHPHAQARMVERGATEEEVIATIEKGEKFPAKFSRTGFRRNFYYNKKWRDKHYLTKQIEAFAIYENDEWLVITVITRYF